MIKEDSSLYNADCLFKRKEDRWRMDGGWIESEQTSVGNILYGTSVLKYFFNKSYAFSAYCDKETIRSLYNNSTRFGYCLKEKLLYCCYRKNFGHVSAFSVAAST